MQEIASPARPGIFPSVCDGAHRFRRRRPRQHPMNHELRAQPCADVPPPPLLRGPDLVPLAAYLRDESRREGHAAALAFPRSTAEVAACLRLAAARNLDVTLSAARTGITAGAVPDGGLLVSLERLNRICGVRSAPDGTFRVRCQAGVLLSDLQKAVRLARFPDSADWDEPARQALEAMRTRRLLYPPDPTETSASVGGTVACNASGAHTFAHGPTRAFVTALQVVLADGSCLDLERGAVHADADGRFTLVRADGSHAEGRVPSYPLPRTKNAAGYWTGPHLDLIDLFIGSEGTLGVITEVEVRLVPAPEASCAVVTFWPEDRQAVDFTLAVRRQRAALGLEAVEYFDPHALNLLRQRRSEVGAASGVPECLPATAASAIYLDLGTPAAAMPGALEQVAALVRAAGGTAEHGWAAVDKDERERLRLFRHALPESVNLRIAEIRRTHPGVSKLGTDMAVPGEHLAAILALYRRRLDEERLEHVIFGHIGDNHLHVNILPRDEAEYRRGQALYLEFAREVVRLGGSPAAEHGIGKLKRHFLPLLFGEEGVAQMRALKHLFDPAGHLARGTWFP